MKDPIVEEIREIRRKHAEKYNNDLHEICKELRIKEKKCGYVLKSFPAKVNIRLPDTKTV